MTRKITLHSICSNKFHIRVINEDGEDYFLTTSSSCRSGIPHPTRGYSITPSLFEIAMSPDDVTNESMELCCLGIIKQKVIDNVRSMNEFIGGLSIDGKINSFKEMSVLDVLTILRDRELERLEQGRV